MGTSTANNKNPDIFTNSTKIVENQQNSIIHRATLTYFVSLTVMVNSLLFGLFQLPIPEIMIIPGKIKISPGIDTLNGDYIFLLLNKNKR